MKFAETSLQDNPLLKIAKEISNKSFDTNELDKPIKSFISEAGPEIKGLTDQEKTKIKEETGWSDEIVNSIGSMKAYDIYKNPGLQESEIDGKKCLIREDIDMNQKDSMGRTNQERMSEGLAPLTKEGGVVELHHMGQKADSPLAELTMKEHRGSENDTILHDKTKESEIDRNKFNAERINHWKNRTEEGV